MRDFLFAGPGRVDIVIAGQCPARVRDGLKGFGASDDGDYQTTKNSERHDVKLAQKDPRQDLRLFPGDSLRCESSAFLWKFASGATDALTAKATATQS